MATQLNKDFKVNFTVYNSYLNTYETHLKNIYTFINEIYSNLNQLCDAPSWCDDNSARVWSWFVKNKNSADSYESAYKTILTVLKLSGTDVCKKIKASQETTYTKYAFVKKYANNADIYGALGSTKYKALKNDFVFRGTAASAKRNPDGTVTYFESVATTKATANAYYKKIVTLCQKLDEESSELASKILRFSSKLEGASNDAVTSAHARLILRESVFTKELKKQIEAGLEKSNLM